MRYLQGISKYCSCSSRRYPGSARAVDRGGTKAKPEVHQQPWLYLCLQGADDNPLPRTVSLI